MQGRESKKLFANSCERAKSSLSSGVEHAFVAAVKRLSWRVDLSHRDRDFGFSFRDRTVIVRH
jgi:hypothetical protein